MAGFIFEGEDTPKKVQEKCNAVYEALSAELEVDAFGLRGETPMFVNAEGEFEVHVPDNGTVQIVDGPNTVMIAYGRDLPETIAQLKAKMQVVRGEFGKLLGVQQGVGLG